MTQYSIRTFVKRPYSVSVLLIFHGDFVQVFFVRGFIIFSIPLVINEKSRRFIGRYEIFLPLFYSYQDR